MKAGIGASAPRMPFRSPAPTSTARIGAVSATMAMASDQNTTQARVVRASYISSPKKIAPP